MEDLLQTIGSEAALLKNIGKKNQGGSMKLNGG